MLRGENLFAQYLEGDSWDLPSDLAILDPAEKRFGQLLVEAGWHKDDDRKEAPIALLTSFREALINAIKHGNKFDLDKRVHVVFQITPSEVRVTIRDEGEGFDPKDVSEPTDEANLLKPSGRGLLMMNFDYDEVVRNEKGNEVTLIKMKRS